MQLHAKAHCPQTATGSEGLLCRMLFRFAGIFLVSEECRTLKISGLGIMCGPGQESMHGENRALYTMVSKRNFMTRI